MTYVVTEACIKCKYTDCVEVCPVACFHEGENMVVIDPETCIDCGVCVPECPAEAIMPDHGEGAEKWVEFNRKYAAQWPNITEPKFPFPDAKDWEKVPDKLKNHFSPKPGK
jgi:ferredoxin